MVIVKSRGMTRFWSTVTSIDPPSVPLGWLEIVAPVPVSVAVQGIGVVPRFRIPMDTTWASALKNSAVLTIVSRAGVTGVTGAAGLPAPPPEQAARMRATAASQEIEQATRTTVREERRCLAVI
jgi:hypothetical protein